MANDPNSIPFMFWNWTQEELDIVLPAYATVILVIVFLVLIWTAAAATSSSFLSVLCCLCYSEHDEENLETPLVTRRGSKGKQYGGIA